MKMKKLAAMVAAVLSVNAMVSVPFSASALETVTYEAEDATIGGVGEVKTEISGYSGTGYVDLTDNTGSLPSVTFKVNVKEAGIYGLTVRYATAYGSKPLEVKVNDKIVDSPTLDASKEFTEKMFKVELAEGESTVVLTASWGWMQVDSITLGDYAPSRPEIVAKHTSPCDPKATEEAKKVMTYLNSVYGEHILSGQQEIYNYGPHGVETEFEYIKEKTGKLPAIRGFDLGNSCNPITSCFGEDGVSDRMLQWAANGGLVESTFHLNVPKNFANYTMGDSLGFNDTTYSEKTDFSPSKAAQEGTKENEFYTKALDTLAEKLLTLQEKGVPVLWRPLHEAQGNLPDESKGQISGSWFWWGSEGEKPYKELWLYTYKYLTETKGCHNLIWEWNTYDYANSADWYPGDEYVDIIGFDKYNCTKYVDNGSGQWVPELEHNDSSIADTFYSIMKRYNNAKMVALMENDSFSTLDNLTMDKAGWLYFMTWYDGGSDDINFLSNPIFNTEKDLIDMYTSDYCITLDELPKFSEIEIDPDATNEVINTEPAEPEEGHASIKLNDNGNLTIKFPEAGEAAYLKVTLPDGATYANGCLGVTVPVDGVYYWASVKWEATKSGTIEVNFAEDLYNVTYTGEDNLPVEIKDKAILDAVKKALSEQTSFEGQVWYVDKGETTDVAITDAYVVSAGATDPTEPTSEDVTDETQPTSEETPSDAVYGDVDGNEEVDIADVLAINQYLLGLNVTINSKNADVDNNGKVNDTDALNILKSLVDLVTLPVTAE
ncbi:MAG: glycosyl hydrolase [Oscillospiraceae bacterium]